MARAKRNSEIWAGRRASQVVALSSCPFWTRILTTSLKWFRALLTMHTYQVNSQVQEPPTTLSPRVPEPKSSYLGLSRQVFWAEVGRLASVVQLYATTLERRGPTWTQQVCKMMDFVEVSRALGHCFCGSFHKSGHIIGTQMNKIPHIRTPR